MKTPKKAGNRKANNIKSTKITKLTKPNKFTKLKNLAAFAVIAFFAGTMLLPALKNINAASTVYEIRTEADIEQALADTTNTDITLKLMNDILLSKMLEIGFDNIDQIRNINFISDSQEVRSIIPAPGFANDSMILIGRANISLNDVALDCKMADRCGGVMYYNYDQETNFTMNGRSAIRNIKNSLVLYEQFTSDTLPRKTIMNDDSRIENIVCEGNECNRNIIAVLNLSMNDNAKITNIRVDESGSKNVILFPSAASNQSNSFQMNDNATIDNITGTYEHLMLMYDGSITLAGNSQIVDNSSDIGSLIAIWDKKLDSGFFTMKDNAKISRNKFEFGSNNQPYLASIVYFRDSVDMTMHGNAEISHNSATRLIDGYLHDGTNASLTLSESAKITDNTIIYNDNRNTAYANMLIALNGDLTLNDDAAIANNTKIISSDVSAYESLVKAKNITLNGRAKFNENSAVLADGFAEPEEMCVYYGGGLIGLDDGDANTVTMNDSSEMVGNHGECGNGSTIFLLYTGEEALDNIKVNLNGGRMSNNVAKRYGGAVGYLDLGSYERVSGGTIDDDAARAALAPEKFLSRIHVGENFTFSGNRAASLHNIQPEDQALYNANVKTNKFSAGTSAYNNYDIQYLKGDPIPETKPDENPDQPENPENPSEPGNPENPENPSSENSGDTENQAENNNFAIQNKKSPAKQFKLIAPNTGKI